MTTDRAPLRKSLVLEMDAPAADPSTAPPPPDDEPLQNARAMATLGAIAPRRPLARMALWVFASLFALILSAAAWDFVMGLFAANTVLGWVAFGLVIAALALALIAAWGEVLAYLRMGRLDTLRTRAAAVGDDLPAARKVVADIVRLYRARPDLSWAMARLNGAAGDVLDADALLALTERELLAPLDRAALAEIESAARQVATITAFVPMALADVAVALYANIRLIRRLSQIYGGRSGSFGSWRLMRQVAGALLGAGSIALADDLVGSVAGGGMLGKISRRFGEGVVNGALTARVGIAAMELSRPLPFAALPRPNTGATISRALAGVFGNKNES